MTIGIDNSFPPAGPAPGPAPSPAPTFDVGLVSSTIIARISSVIAGRVAPVVINYHIRFYYRKAVTAEDLTSSKLHIKGIIWIRGIPFSNTTKT